MERLRETGLPGAAIRKYFIPTWCDSSMYNDAAARQEAFIEIAKRLGVTYAELVSDTGSIRLAINQHSSAFGENKNKQETRLAASRFIGIRLANIVAEAYSQSGEFVICVPKKFSENTASPFVMRIPHALRCMGVSLSRTHELTRNASFLLCFSSFVMCSYAVPNLLKSYILHPTSYIITLTSSFH